MRFGYWICNALLEFLVHYLLLVHQIGIIHQESGEKWSSLGRNTYRKMCSLNLPWQDISQLLWSACGAFFLLCRSNPVLIERDGRTVQYSFLLNWRWSWLALNFPLFYFSKLSELRKVSRTKQCFGFFQWTPKLSLLPPHWPLASPFSFPLWSSCQLSLSSA